MTLRLLAVLLVLMPASGASAPRDVVEDARLAIRTKDFTRAVGLLRAAAHDGDAEAQYLLGLAASNAIGMEPDAALARRSLEQAARQGHSRAAYALAALESQGGAEDRRQAAEWLQRAADSGHAPALAARESGRLPLADARLEPSAPETLRFAIAQFAARSDDVELLRAVGDAGVVARRDEFGRTLLFLAADKAARAATRELLKLGAVADVADQSGMTPLMLAAVQHDEEITAALLAGGARVQPVDHAGRGALFHAAAANQAGQVRRLLAAGAPLDAVDAEGGTASDAALRHGATEALDTLRAAGGHITRRASPQAAGIDFTREGQLYQGWPPLLLAVARDDAAEVRRRAGAGESLAVRTPGGESGLQIAIASRAVQSLRTLIELGADAHREEDGRGLAQLVAESGDADLGRAWVELVAPTAAEAQTLLLGAVEHADTDLARRILARGASPETGAPLIRAAQLGNLEVVKLLLDRGARPDALDDARRSVLWHAAASRQPTIVELLLSMRVPVDAHDRHGATPLVAAIGAGDALLVRRLLDAGADVDGPAAGGQAPLRVAAERGDTDIIAALLARRPRIDAVDGFGETALIVAARRGDEATCLALLQAGADARLRGRDRSTAADVAEARGFTALARRLRG